MCPCMNVPDSAAHLIIPLKQQHTLIIIQPHQQVDEQHEG